MPHKDPEVRKAYAKRAGVAWAHANPEKVRAIKARHYQKHAARIREESAEYRRNHGGQHRAAVRCSHIRTYGLTPEDYRKMLHDQGGVCAICQRPETIPVSARDPRPRSLSIDHCHASGQIRALLCGHCNTGIGKFGEDCSRLEAAAAYLRRFRP